MSRFLFAWKGGFERVDNQELRPFMPLVWVTNEVLGDDRCCLAKPHFRENTELGAVVNILYPCDVATKQLIVETFLSDASFCRSFPVK